MRSTFARNLILTLLVCVFATSLAIAATSFADEKGPVIEVQSVAVHRGQRFAVEINLCDSQGFVGLLLTVGYDSDVFTLVDYERGQALSNMQLTTGNLESASDGEFRFLWDSAKADFSCGKLLTLIFDSNIEAKADDYEIKLSYSANDALSDYGKKQTLTVKNGVVSLAKGKYSVCYVNYDGVLLQHSEYNEDEIPTYKGKDPVRLPDRMYVYRWSGEWQSVLSDDQSKLVFEPVYKLVPQRYQVLYYVADSIDSTPKLRLDYSGYIGYGEMLDLPSPQKEGYAFSGWYEDMDYVGRFSSVFMTDCDLQLFGYFAVALRTAAPLFRLSCSSQTDEKVALDLSVSDNYGLSAVSMELAYDASTFSLVRIDRDDALASADFSYNDNDGKIRLLWQSAANDYSVGKVISLVFDVNRQAKTGGYDFLLTYNEKSDAIYFDTNGNLWYTKLRLSGCNVAVGNLYGWHCRLQNGVWAEARLTVPVPSNVTMELRDLSDEIIIGKNVADALSADNATACSAYKISFIVDGADFRLPCSVKIKLHIASLQLNDNVRLYKLTDDGATQWEFNLNENYVEFIADGSSDWLVARSDKNYGAIVIICLLSAISVASLCAAAIVIVKNKKKSLRRTKEVQNDNFEYDS